jgi:hypothetical protein
LTTGGHTVTVFRKALPDAGGRHTDLFGANVAVQIPDYWMRRPDLDLDEGVKKSFDSIMNGAVQDGNNAVIQYTLPAPKWKFLCYVSEQYSCVLHGSGENHIAAFEPRQSSDVNTFGNQKAVYAAADGIWPIFYAVCDRIRHKITINNACIYLIEQGGTRRGPLYFFSITKAALQKNPWRNGTIYILPKKTFTAQPLVPFGEHSVYVPQLASTAPVKPLARLAVAPEDFPFINNIRGHDDGDLEKIAAAMLRGEPLP